MDKVYVVVVDNSAYNVTKYDLIAAAFSSRELAEKYLDENMFEKLKETNGDPYWVDTFNRKHTIVGVVLGDSYYIDE